MVFRNGGILPRNLEFLFDNVRLEIVNKFTYLVVVFTPGEPPGVKTTPRYVNLLTETQNMLAGQARKALFMLEKYTYKFTTLTTNHMISLFDKLILPILNYCSEVWGFTPTNTIEKLNYSFVKKLLGVKKSTQNDFVFGEFGRTTLLVRRYYIIIKYWFKVLTANEGEYIKYIYNIMLSDLDVRPDTKNWAYLIRDLLSNLGFYDVWLNQGVGNVQLF